MKKFKEVLYDVLFTHLGLSSKILNGFIAFLIIISIAILPFYFFSYFKDIYETLWIIETVIITIFTLEFFLKIYASKKTTEYIFSFSFFIDAIIIIPFFLIEFSIIENSHFLMLLQILRIIKVIQIYNSERKNIKHDEITEHGSFKLLKGEVIYSIAHKHYFIFLFSFFPIIIITFFSLASLLVFPSLQTLILSIIFAIIAFTKFVKSWIDFHYDAMYVTSNRLVIQDQHIFGANRTEIPYRAIVQILPNQSGFIRSFFDFGDIAIETAGDSTNSFVKYIPHMEKILKIITEQIEKNKNPMFEYQEKEEKRKRKESEDINDKKSNSDSNKKSKKKKKNGNKKRENNILTPTTNHPLFEDDIKEIQKKNYKNIFSLFSKTKK